MIQLHIFGLSKFRLIEVSGNWVWTVYHKIIFFTSFLNMPNFFHKVPITSSKILVVTPVNIVALQALRLREKENRPITLSWFAAAALCSPTYYNRCRYWRGNDSVLFAPPKYQKHESIHPLQMVTRQTHLSSCGLFCTMSLLFVWKVCFFIE